MSDLPEGWTKEEIGSLCSLENGRAFKPTDWTTTGFPIVRIQNLNNPNASFNYFDQKVDERYFLRGGELLFAWSGTPGTSFGAHVWKGGEAVLNQHIFRVDLNYDLVEKRFFRFAINQKLNELIGIAHGGVGLRHVTKGKFEKTEVVLPPLNEQKRIADRLDQLLTRIDKTKAHLDRIPPLLKRFRQSVLAAATSGRLTEDWREYEPLDQWEDTSIGELTTEIRYGTSKKCDYEPRATPVLRIPNIGDGIIRHEDMKFAEFDDSEVKKLALIEGDILVIRSNGSLNLVGKTALISEKENGFLFAGYLIRLRMKQEIANPKYISQHISSPSVRDVIEITARSTSGVNNINTEELKALEICLPPIEEQQEVVRRVEALFAKADRIEAQYKSARQQVDRLTPALLAKAFRGELVPQDPNDEPASVLLERVGVVRSIGQPAKTKRQKKA